MPLRSCAWRITKTWWNSPSALILVLSTAPHQSFLELVFSRMRFKIVTAHADVLGRHVCSELPRTFWDRLRYHLGRPHNSGYRAMREPQVLTAPAHRTDPDAIVWRGDVFHASGGRGCDDIRHATRACGVCQHEAGCGLCESWPPRSSGFLVWPKYMLRVVHPTPTSMCSSSWCLPPQSSQPVDVCTTHISQRHSGQDWRQGCHLTRRRWEIDRLACQTMGGNKQPQRQ